MSRGSDKPGPRRITLVCCPVCLQVAFSNVDLPSGHSYRGHVCEGKPESVMYLKEDR